MSLVTMPPCDLLPLDVFEYQRASDLWPILVWVPPEAEPEAGITVQTVYPGGDCRKHRWGCGDAEREVRQEKVRFQVSSIEGN